MSIRERLEALGLEPQKSLGQNFMVEKAMFQKMIEAASLENHDVVLEIGPGLGDLTEVLIEKARRVIAVEIDKGLAGHLENTYHDIPQLRIVHADFLRVALNDLLGDDAHAYKVIANVPYYITSAILRKLLESSTPPQEIVVTVQWEVAERVTAKPGDMSVLAVSVQLFGTPKIIKKLKPGIFYPRPNVDSAILSITPHPAGAPLSAEDIPVFFRIVKAGFSQPRKQIKTPLSSGLSMKTETTINWLEGVGIDPRRRAETLSLDEWLTLFHHYQQVN